jgi:hypothetical protein
MTAAAKKKIHRMRRYNLPGNNLTPVKDIKPDDSS